MEWIPEEDPAGKLTEKIEQAFQNYRRSSKSAKEEISSPAAPENQEFTREKSRYMKFKPSSKPKKETKFGKIP